MDDIHTQIVVVGGGPAGVCAALASAGQGVSTVLVTNRPVLGGNSSSEIRVWSRGAVGGGNLFAEEMGLWGMLKLENLYRNPDGNPVFWDDILLDAVLNQENLSLYLNTDISEILMDGTRVASVSGAQQGTERILRFTADCFIDATGDGSLCAKVGVPYEVGDASTKETMGSSILFFTRRENHPVPFIPPDYAYSLEKIEALVNRGGRVVSQEMGGSDCWWFEYGGLCDTIGDAQEIGLELRRLTLGIWNYIKNSGRFPAENHTLEWLGAVPGKRESRRMLGDGRLTARNILEQRPCPDAGFYGGWYLDVHPAGGIQDTGSENCVQTPVSVYPIPLSCLYWRDRPNLFFAGRHISMDREAFFSSRVMNTCALSGQAAGTLAAFCLDRGIAPAALSDGDIQTVQQRLLREDVFIPGIKNQDPEDLARSAHISASSVHSGNPGREVESFPLDVGGFVTFPSKAGDTVSLLVQSQDDTVLTAQSYCSTLPNRLKPGTPMEDLSWPLHRGTQELKTALPHIADNTFCTWVFPPTPGVSVIVCQSGRTGFLCGTNDSSQYKEPMLTCQRSVPLYGPEQVVNGYARPWDGVNQWRASPNDREPWLALEWDQAQVIREVRLYLDPDLSMELVSSRAPRWQESHHFTARYGMPDMLVRDLCIQAQMPDGNWKTVCTSENNRRRMIVLPFPQPVHTSKLRICFVRMWGAQPPAVFEIRIYS